MREIEMEKAARCTGAGHCLKQRPEFVAKVTIGTAGD
jgi:hypothetical protein